jgi:hypothetical protein
VAALHVTGENDPWILLDDLAVVYMAERPVVVTLSCEVIDSAGCVLVVAVAAVQRRVQQSDVEEVPAGRGIAESEVVGDVPPRGTLTVHRQPDPLVEDGLGLVDVEHVNVVRQPQLVRHRVMGIVVPGDDVDGEPSTNCDRASALGLTVFVASIHLHLMIVRLYIRGAATSLSRRDS